ncbi:AraC family transcriptional regulator [Niabella drilacis]|uniref:AraC-type DNA-binding protein n=1 Tax=Niabella drilacis (strain DSM 25811 / CCM 8410 / CCUG 62505 / LMG 26954 / E90) TaxID=1285928 RepID=A0A1G7BI52_NIADE|nr:AraC family transcriptional regulator [Niabella drilacis]SDE26788.1 AraC-type DNA-binding protein [Niabella drilacis]
MKPILLKITSGPAISFSARSDSKSYKNNSWHYHPEFELIHVVKGAGTLFAGDGIHYFKSGDLVLIGSYLPHYWKFDSPYTTDKPEKSYIELTQFREDFWGKDFLLIPENQKIAALLEKSKQGLVLKGARADTAKEILTSLIAATDTKRIILLLELLSCITECRKTGLISSAYQSDNPFTQSERINKIYNYTLQHFKSPIYIKDIAALTNLTENSFCRYFKSCTRKSYTQFIAELRIGHACKLLSEGQKSIKEICYESGFNNITHFNRLFKRMKKIQPNEYRKLINT